MSVQFGQWNFEGLQPTQHYLTRVAALLNRYGLNANGSYSSGGVVVLYRAFHTTKESRRETQPHISRGGAVIAWDGRLDNRSELIDSLRIGLAIHSTDVEIVSAAYETWGANCFGKLIGDWALSIHSPTDKSLLLAKDPIGSRHLYYAVDKNRITWCTVLDPLILCADKTFALCEEYLAGWLSAYPAVHLSPYSGIYAVPPSSYVLLKSGTPTLRRYWDFDPGKKIRYRSDAEYEEHFRSIFAKSVQCRLRSDSPVLAELSGGRDSSSIVCMADILLGRGAVEAPRLDTVSYYDDSEPNWNERPYFAKVEEKRRRQGWHIDASLECSGKTSEFGPDYDCTLVPTPGFRRHISSRLRICLESQGNRVLLSGVGGDEVMGGAPTPIPELQDLLASAQIGMLAHQLKAWALQQRKPWFHLFLESALGFFPSTVVRGPQRMRPAPWLRPRFVNRHQAALAGYPRRVKLFGPLPSFQDNISTLRGLQRQLASVPLPFDVPYDKSYPYLDRNLLEFMFAIPREQSVRPTQRRSLMRRAFAGIVPDEILNRKRKASVTRSPLVRLARDWANLVAITPNMISDSIGIVNMGSLVRGLEEVRQGKEPSSLSLRRAIHIEAWLRTIVSRGIVNFEAAQGTEFIRVSMQR
jgi:asparagine synthase (glutamine-hydrolysing)